MNGKLNETLLNRIKDHIRCNELAPAEILCHELASLNDHSADVLHLCGIVCLKQGKLEQAYTWLKKAEERRPDSPLIMHELATVHFLAGDFESAIRLLKKALWRSNRIFRKRTAVLGRFLQRLEDLKMPCRVFDKH